MKPNLTSNKIFLVPLKERITLMDYAYMLQKFGAFNAPRQFQRPIAWKVQNRILFFQSILMNRVEGSYVLVDVKSCISRLELAGECDSETYKFFKKFLNAGFKYVILDGNNRMSFIQALFNDDFIIPPGKYEYVTDEVNGTITSFVVRKGKQKFSELPERVREILQARQAAISLYTQITLEGMSEVFQNVNSGVPLNGQELRNAYSSLWAEYVRKIADEISTLLAKLFKDHRYRLKGEEWIVDCLDFVLQATDNNPITNEVTFHSVTQSTKNKLYKSTFLVEEDSNFYADKFIELMDFMTLMIEENILDYKCLTRASAVQNLYWMMCNGIDTYEQVVNAVEMHDTEYNNKTATYTCGDDEKTFKECCNGMSAENIKARYEVLKKIISTVVGEEDFSSIDQSLQTEGQ